MKVVRRHFLLFEKNGSIQPALTEITPPWFCSVPEMMKNERRTTMECSFSKSDGAMMMLVMPVSSSRLRTNP
jgi:hypothetical protein